MSTFGQVANMTASSEGQTFCELSLAIAKALHPPDHPEILFAEWLNENRARLGEACVELGVEPPKEGLALYRRLRSSVMPILKPGDIKGNKDEQIRIP